MNGDEWKIETGKIRVGTVPMNLRSTDTAF